jgi:alkanesulfonate monooxygenase SsuD/methylene tetrahydromethanopterin reductase-like flavin-dependent oxidoreductase (luciferase family)
MFTEDEPVFDGEFYSIDKPINEPKGVSKPHPPIWIGGGGEKVTLKLVAKWGDACNVGGGDVEVMKHKFEVLKGHCENEGRDYDEITRSTSVNVHLIDDGENPEQATKEARGETSYDQYSDEFIVGTAEEITERLQPMVDTGVEYFITYLPRVAHEPEIVERYAEQVVSNFD